MTMTILLLVSLLLPSPTSTQVTLTPEERETLLTSLPPLLLNFVFPKFVLGPIDYNFLLQEEKQEIQTRLAPVLNRVRVDPVNSNLKPDFNLLEFILLNVDFNYLDQVPEKIKPDI